MNVPKARDNSKGMSKGNGHCDRRQCLSLSTLFLSFFPFRYSYFSSTNSSWYIVLVDANDTRWDVQKTQNARRHHDGRTTDLERWTVIERPRHIVENIRLGSSVSRELSRPSMRFTNREYKAD